MEKRDDTEMRFEEAKEYIKQQLPFYLEGKGISTRKNFCCLNPEHLDTNPSMSYDPKRNKCHCFSCNANYDIFDLIAIDYSFGNNSNTETVFERHKRAICFFLVLHFNALLYIIALNTCYVYMTFVTMHKA